MATVVSFHVIQKREGDECEIGFEERGNDPAVADIGAGDELVDGLADAGPRGDPEHRAEDDDEEEAEEEEHFWRSSE